MRFRQHRAGERIDRAVARDDADGIIQRRKQRIDRLVPLRAELLSGGSEEGAVGAEILQPVGDLAAAVGVPSITTRPRRFGRCLAM
jgi:hypothetical protein